MYFREEYLRENKAIDRNNTYKLDLPAKGFLSSLQVKVVGRVETGNPMAALAKWRLLDYLTKFEILADGDFPIQSLSPYIQKYGTFIDHKMVSGYKEEEYSQPYMREYFMFNFGRKFQDTEMGLDLSAFNSVEFHLTNALNTSYFQDETTISLKAYFLEESTARPFSGYIKKDQWREWPTVQDETKYLNLPLTYPYRRIILRTVPGLDANEIENTSFWNLADDVELSLKSGASRVFKGGIDDLAYRNMLEIGQHILGVGNIYHTADKGFYTLPGYVQTMIVGAASAGGAVVTTIPTAKNAQNSSTQVMETYVGDEIPNFLAYGIAPWHCTHFGFDLTPDPASWLNAQANGEILLDVHTRNASSAASGTNYVALERFVKY